MRYTPAGVPVSEARLRHESELIEAGVKRKVDVEIGMLALGETAHFLDGVTVGSPVNVTGFIAAKSRNSRQLVLHVLSIEFLEGTNNHGIQV
jgi:primosomal replication protein N